LIFQEITENSEVCLKKAAWRKKPFKNAEKLPNSNAARELIFVL